MVSKIGEYEVLESGTVISLEGAPVVFTIGPLKITFKFRTEQEEVEKKMKVNVDFPSEREAEIEFLNFDDPIGCGNSNPKLLGKYDGKELSFLIRVSNLSKGGKTIAYTWLLKEV